MADQVLDNIIWHSLSGRRRSYAVRTDEVRAVERNRPRRMGDIEDRDP